MADAQHHRKRIKHYHAPGDLHELTFSCFQRRPLLANDRWCGYLSESIDAATASLGIGLLAFVFMPEHVHLVVGIPNDVTIVSRFLAAIKRPTAARIKVELESAGSPLKESLTTHRAGSASFHFWQAGPGYDRNLQTAKVVAAAIDYIHLNPVRRGLCQSIFDWKWSSALALEASITSLDPDVPQLSRLHPEMFDD